MVSKFLLLEILTNLNVKIFVCLRKSVLPLVSAKNFDGKNFLIYIYKLYRVGRLYQ